MKKRGPWQLVIVDKDKKRYAITGPIANDDSYNKRVCEEQKKGKLGVTPTHLIPLKNPGLWRWGVRPPGWVCKGMETEGRRPGERTGGRDPLVPSPAEVHRPFHTVQISFVLVL
jgi:hypothetical protein